MSKHRTHVAAPSHTRHQTVAIEAPGAHSVSITGCFCDWAKEGRPLRNDGKGVWKTTLDLKPGRYEYRFVVDGEWRDDPNCSVRVANPFGTQNCVMEV